MPETYAIPVFQKRSVFKMDRYLKCYLLLWRGLKVHGIRLLEEVKKVLKSVAKDERGREHAYKHRLLGSVVDGKPMKVVEELDVTFIAELVPEVV